ncbi:hypothetical protein SLS62_004152 [Diatrype stigma]|uniref:HRDC domain-containing protein n=1 Tax=Diatrype stigma TaxID=117547 RepID=A0AAN9UV63_9PEZI
MAETLAVNCPPLLYKHLKGTQYWSHAFYRDPEKNRPQVFYSTTIEESEVLAQKFLHEPVLGFDGEWCSWYPKPDTPLKSIFSLLQVASEDKIGLFHIARHEGETPEDLIAPSLRKIIESPDIIKTGVKIHGADLLRLQQYFHLNPQGGFELSNLHRLVTHMPGSGLVALAKQVQYHLGLPLSKGPVRTSNWMRPLSPEQKFYAADDASSRRQLALVDDVPLYMVAADKVLRALAQARPTNDTELARVPGIGYHRIKQYGREWLRIISQFLAEHPAPPVPQGHGIFVKTPSDLNIMAQQPLQSPNRGRKRAASTSEQEVCAGPPLLHTGLSFHMDEANLRENEPPQTGGKGGSDTSAVGNSLPSPTSPEGEHKRRRCETSLPNQNAVTQLNEKKDFVSNTSEAVRGTANCDQHPAKQPQASVDEIDYFSDQDEDALWAEAFENLDPHTQTAKLR